MRTAKMTCENRQDDVRNEKIARETSVDSI